MVGKKENGIGKTLYTYRMKAVLKQHEAAEKIGVSAGRLANWETDRSEPPIVVLKKMAKVYGATVDQLIVEA
jgi:transcriptional regulator with XRE-family HTH domain